MFALMSITACDKDPLSTVWLDQDIDQIIKAGHNLKVHVFVKGNPDAGYFVWSDDTINRSLQMQEAYSIYLIDTLGRNKSECYHSGYHLIKDDYEMTLRVQAAQKDTLRIQLYAPYSTQAFMEIYNGYDSLIYFVDINCTPNYGGNKTEEEFLIE